MFVLATINLHHMHWDWMNFWYNDFVFNLCSLLILTFVFTVIEKEYMLWLCRPYGIRCDLEMNTTARWWLCPFHFLTDWNDYRRHAFMDYHNYFFLFFFICFSWPKQWTKNNNATDIGRLTQKINLNCNNNQSTDRLTYQTHTLMRAIWMHHTKSTVRSDYARHKT